MKKRQSNVQIEFNHPVPQFAVRRVEDFLSAWNPNVEEFKYFVTSLYLQGLSDGYAIGETFERARSKGEK